MGRTLRATSVYYALFFFSLVSSALAKQSGPQPPHVADPFIDPKDDPYNPLTYIASNALTGLAISLVLATALLQTLFTWKWGARWMLSMVIGEYFFALGIAIRFGLHKHPDSQGLYIVEYLFVVLSPCAFIAADYVLLGRLARHIGCDRHLLVNPRRITIAFISSDISTFLIQAVGGSLSVSANAGQQALTGSHIFLAGLALQLLSFFTFTCVYLVFLYRVYNQDRSAWLADRGGAWYRDRRALSIALLISCIGILIRSVYRVVELSQGFEGRLASLEGFFYGLDTLPLFVAVAIYVPFWPGRFIPVAGSELARNSSDVEKPN